MHDQNTRQKWIELAFVVAIALVVRVIYLNQLASSPDWSRLSVDNWYHHNWGTAIAHGNFWGDTTYFRAPFYAWCLGALYAVFSPSILVARFFGAAIGIASVILTHRIADKIAGRRAALIAALVQSVYPILIMTETDLLLDPLFMLLLQLVVIGMLYWTRRRTAFAMLLLSIIAGLAAITRPTILVLLPPLFGIVLWQIRHSRRACISQFFATLLGLSVTVGVVFARNVIVADDPVVIASQGGINLFIGNNETADGLHAVMPEPLGYNWRIADITYLAEKATGHTLKPGEISSFWSGEAWEWISHDPFQFAALTLKRFWYSLAEVEINNNRDQAALKSRIPIVKYNPLGFGLVFILAVLGVVLIWNSSPSVRWLVFSVMALSLINALFFVNSRFRLPMLPVYFVLAGVAVDLLLTRRHTIVHRGCLAIVAGLAAIVTFVPVLTLPAQWSPQDYLSNGLVFYNGGDYNSALNSYRDAFATDSAFPDVNANLGAAFLRLGFADSAQVYFQREMSLHPKRPLAYANAAALALVQDKFESASALALASVNRKPYDPTPWIILIRASARTVGIRPDSLRTVCVRACNTTHNNLDVCIEAAAALDNAGDKEGAIELYARGAKSQPLPVETDDRMFTSGYWSAIAKDQRQRARASMSLGALYGRRGEFAQAASFSAAAIATDSTLSGAWVNLISAKLQLGLDSQAKELLQRAITRFPSDPLILALKSQVSP